MGGLQSNNQIILKVIETAMAVAAAAAVTASSVNNGSSCGDISKILKPKIDFTRGYARKATR